MANTLRRLRGWSKYAYNESKMAKDRNFEKQTTRHITAMVGKLSSQKLDVDSELRSLQ